MHHVVKQPCSAYTIRHVFDISRWRAGRFWLWPRFPLLGFVQADFRFAYCSQILIELLAIAGTEFVFHASSAFEGEIENAAPLLKPFFCGGFLLCIAFQK